MQRLLTPRTLAALLAAFSMLSCASPAQGPAATGSRRGMPAAHTSRAATGGLELAPCTAEMGFSASALCGVYEVYENREARAGRKIGLRVVVLPASDGLRAGSPDPGDAITYFSGGPGAASTEAASWIGEQYAAARRDRDVMLVDFRGTGGSNDLRCAYQDLRLGYTEAFLPLDGVRECWRDSQAKADPNFYTTANAVDDVDEVRAALGYEKLTLAGASYGTRAALAYAQRHPEHTRALILDGPVPANTASPLTFARDAQAALDGWMQECAEDSDCSATFPRLQEDFAQVIARLDEGPVEVEAMNPQNGEIKALSLTRDAFSQTVRYMLYSSNNALKLPLYIHLAAGGDLGPMAEMTMLFAGLVDGISDGFYLSVTCAEDVPFYSMDEAQEAARGTFLGTYRARSQKEACVEWPVRKAPESEMRPVRSDVPALIRAGERDPVTPPRWGREIAARLPNAKLVVIPDGAHGPGGLSGVDCLQEIEVKLIESGSMAGLEPEDCVAGIRRGPFTLALPKEEFVELPAEDLARYAGRYGSEEPPMSMQVTLEEGKLILHPAGIPPVALAPLSKEKMKILGAPPGFYLIFELDADGSPTGVTLEQGDMGNPLPMQRLDESP